MRKDGFGDVEKEVRRLGDLLEEMQSNQNREEEIERSIKETRLQYVKDMQDMLKLRVQQTKQEWMAEGDTMSKKVFFICQAKEATSVC